MERDWDALTHGVEGRTQGGLMRWVGQAFFNSNIYTFFFWLAMFESDTVFGHHLRVMEHYHLS